MLIGKEYYSFTTVKTNVNTAYEYWFSEFSLMYVERGSRRLEETDDRFDYIKRK